MRFLDRNKSVGLVRCRHICSNFGLKELVNLICLGAVSVNGVDKLEMNVNEKNMYQVLQMRKSSWLVVESGLIIWQQSSSFVSSNRILPFVYTFSGIFVELLKVIQSAGMC